MARKATIEEILNKIYKIHRENVILLEYGGKSAAKSLFKCSSCNNTWYNTLNHVLGGESCPKCAISNRSTKRRINLNTAQEKINIVHGDSIIILEYPGDCDKKSIFRCCNCNNVWSTTFSSVYRSKTGCPKCNIGHPPTLDKTTVINRISDIHGESISLLEYSGDSKTHSKFRCNICNNIWNTSASHIFAKKGCPKCNTGGPKLSSFDEISDKINKTHGKLVELLSYGGTLKSHSKFRCGICGNKWSSVTDSVIRGCSCPKCSFSKGEMKISSYSNLIAESHISQIKYSECIDKMPLPFDFYFPRINTLVEYNGEHHYRPVNFGGISDDDAKINFIHTQRHDQIKRDFCKANGIRLLVIPYWEFDNIEKILSKELGLGEQN